MDFSEVGQFFLKVPLLCGEATSSAELPRLGHQAPMVVQTTGIKLKEVAPHYERQAGTSLVSVPLAAGLVVCSMKKL